MPTPTKGPRLGGGPQHEKHMLANLAASLFEHGRITTTEAKARRLRPYAERLITFAKRGDLAARRRVLKLITQKDIVHTLFAEIGPKMADRPGGYTRIVKIGPRKGDNAPMCFIEIVDEPVVAKPVSARARTTAAAPAQTPVPTEGVEETPVVEVHEQVAVPAEGGDTEVVTEAAEPTAEADATSTDAGDGPGEAPTSDQTAGAGSESQAEGDDDTAK